jgi:hypothetical protein
MHILLDSLAMSFDRAGNQPPAGFDLGTEKIEFKRGRQKILALHQRTAKVALKGTFLSHERDMEKMGTAPLPRGDIMRYQWLNAIVWRMQFPPNDRT